ncbi:hypothetical protein BOX15_Mlig007978g3, partial [Macrostomum lignano]
LIAKPSRSSAAAHFQTAHSVQPQAMMDENNNAGQSAAGGASAAKPGAAVLQPKVGRLKDGKNKRVICIYDTTTDEGSDDQASLDATPIENKNSALPAAQAKQPQQDMQQQQQPLLSTQQVVKNSSDNDCDQDLMAQAVAGLEEIKALITRLSHCQSCRQRLSFATVRSAQSLAVSVDASSTSASAVTSSGQASLLQQQQPLPVRSAHHNSAASAAGPADPNAQRSKRRRVVRKVVRTKRIRSSGSSAAPGEPAAAATDKRVEVASTSGDSAGARRIRSRARRTSGAGGGGGAADSNSRSRQSRSEPAEAPQTAAQHATQTATTQATTVSAASKKPKMVRATKILVKRRRPDQGKRKDSDKSEPTMAQAPAKQLQNSGTSGDHKKKLSRRRSSGGGGGGGVSANGNNDSGVKPISRSTVQDLVNMLQSALSSSEA